MDEPNRTRSGFEIISTRTTAQFNLGMWGLVSVELDSLPQDNLPWDRAISFSEEITIRLTNAGVIPTISEIMDFYRTTLCSGAPERSQSTEISGSKGSVGGETKN
jgi:hypothetical protein